jgi:hypothetical protein
LIKASGDGIKGEHRVDTLIVNNIMNTVAKRDERKKKDWFELNWKWFVPTAVLLFLIVCAAFFSGIITLVFVSFKSSDVYTIAVETVQSHVTAREVLGEPIRTKWYVTGEINISGSNGHAELAIPVYGTRRAGMVYLEAEKRDGQWFFDYLILHVHETGEKISLLDEKDRIPELEDNGVVI